MQKRITMPIAITTLSLSALLSTVMVAVKSKGYAITTYPYLPPLAILEPLW
jgi:hypothetical protein